MVMFVPGYLKEARRLGHDAHVGIVSVLDGLPKAQLKGLAARGRPRGQLGGHVPRALWRAWSRTPQGTPAGP